LKIFTICSFIIFLLCTSAPAQTALDTLYCEEVDVESIKEYKEMLEFGCSLGCAVGWKYDATSVLETQGDNSYGPENLADCDFNTAWVEGAEDYGIGEEIIINFDMPEQMENLNFDGIDFVNGYAKTSDTWSANSRVRTFKVWLNNEPLFYITLKDTDWPQTIRFNEEHIIYLNPGDIVSLEIVDIYAGKKYKDTAITEMNLFGAH
jgi:hypothetical protein